MNAVQIKFYDLLRKELNLSDDKAAVFVTTLGEVAELELKNERQSAASKNDINNLNLKTEQQFTSLREDIHLLELKIEQSKGDLYKAVFWNICCATACNFKRCSIIVKFVS